MRSKDRSFRKLEGLRAQGPSYLIFLAISGISDNVHSVLSSILNDKLNAISARLFKNAQSFHNAEKTIQKVPWLHYHYLSVCSCGHSE